MKQNIIKVTCGFATAALASFALVACDNNSTTAPSFDGTKSSAIEVPPTSSEATPTSSANNPSSSSQNSAPESSAAIVSSSAATVSSSSAIAPGSSTTVSSSSTVIVSSSATIQSSSSAQKEQCIDMARMCPPCEGELCPIPVNPCNQCINANEGDVATECNTGERYVCGQNNTWNLICTHLIDSNGKAKKNVQCNYGPDLIQDCGTNKIFICQDRYWHEPTEDVDSLTKPCSNNGRIKDFNLKYYTEAGLLINVQTTFYCNNGKWTKVKRSEPTDSTLEGSRCEERFDKVKVLDKNYRCSKNKIWIKDVCEHISDVDGMTANGNCVGRDDEIVTDCATAAEYRCVMNYWQRMDVCQPGGDCDNDGIPDGIDRPDLAPCDTEGDTLEFYGRHYKCHEGKWTQVSVKM